jgi:hypothetical protein
MTVETAWQRVDPGPLMKTTYPGTRAWQRETPGGHLTVFVGREADLSFSRPLWHLSISHRTNEHPPQPGRYPDWDEIVEARYRFIPDGVNVAMLLPPRAEWVNVHPTTFHLWEIERPLS